MEFEDLQVEFLVDEDRRTIWRSISGYMELVIQTALIRFMIGNRIDAPIDAAERSQLNLYSDGTMNINNSSNIPSFKVKFQNLFPVSLTTLEFDASLTDLDYLKRLHIQIYIILLKRLLPVVDD